jgi:NAD(P)H-flavin reductase
MPGVEGGRPFSIANSPQDIARTGELEINVRIIEGGAGTAYLHNSLKVGDALTISGPYGRFFVRTSEQAPIIFMAGGSGLSSPRSMILDLLAQGYPHQLTLVYGQRNLAELYYDAEFKALAQQYPNFTYVPALSEDATGFNGLKGFVHEAAKEHFNGDFSGHKAYLCGPPVMIEACLATLMQGRLYERDMYAEKFITAADASKPRSAFFNRVCRLNHVRFPSHTTHHAHTDRRILSVRDWREPVEGHAASRPQRHSGWLRQWRLWRVQNSRASWQYRVIGPGQSCTCKRRRRSTGLHPCVPGRADHRAESRSGRQDDQTIFKGVSRAGHPTCDNNNEVRR